MKLKWKMLGWPGKREAEHNGTTYRLETRWNGNIKSGYSLIVNGEVLRRVFTLSAGQKLAEEHAEEHLETL